ncbi:MAG: hypothetical protein ACTMIA_16700, partial [Vibrio sp.]
GSAPVQVKSAFPLLKQPGDAKIVMWLTHEPLTQKVADDLASAEPEDIATFGQVFDLKAASEGSQPDMAPNDEIDSILSSLMASTSLLNWTSATLEPQSSSAPLLVDYEKETPQNSYLVCLNDPIGITTDLCREFSLAYGMAMEVFKQANHPYMMADLTETYINFEVNNKKVETSRKVAEWRKHPEYGHSAGTTYTQWNADRAVAAYEDELKEAVYYDRMTQYKSDHQDAVKDLNQQLNNLGVDWIAWLKSEPIDWALAWYDLGDESHIEAKEMMVNAMTNNLSSLNAGCQLRNGWVEQLGQCYQENSLEPFEGAGGHIFISLGYAGSVFATGSKWLNSFKSLANTKLSAQEQANAYFNLLHNLPAKAATDSLIMEFAHAVTHYSVKQNIPQLYYDLYDTTGFRSGYAFKKVSTNLGDVQTSIKATAAYEQHVATKASIPPFAAFSDNTPLELIDLDQPVSPKQNVALTAVASTRPGRFFVRQLTNYRVREGSLVTGIQKATSAILSPAIQNTTTSMVFLAQIYNVAKLNENSSLGKVAGSWVSLVSSSFATLELLIKKFGKGVEATFKLGDEQSVNWVSQKVTNLLEPFANSLKSSKASMGFKATSGGRVAGTVFKVTMKYLPIVGSAFASSYSFDQFKTDLNNNEGWGTLTVSFLGLVINGGILLTQFAGLWLGIAELGLPLIVFGAIAALLLGFWHEFLATPKSVQFLARTFWGRGNYKYVEDNEKLSIDERIATFADKDTQNQATIQDTIDNELTAFLDHICKPKVGIASQSVNEQGLSTFTVEVQLIGYEENSSAELQLQGYNQADRRVLVAAYDDELTTRHASVQILPIQKQAIFSLQVNESNLIQEDDTKYINFDDYQLAITYNNPINIPISLRYPNIEIDDDGWWWSNNTSVDQDFTLASSE